MTAPPLTLLVPCFNAAGFLPRLWECVRAQTTPFAAVICYDDASTDDTAGVARALGAVVIRGGVNRGAAHARNQLWRRSATECVHFHDADDLLDPEFTRRMSLAMAPQVDAVICSARWLRDDTRRVEIEWRYSHRELQQDPVAYLLTHPVGGINGCYRRSALERIGGYDERLRIWEDADLHVRLAAAGARFSVVEEVLVTALRRASSFSQDQVENWHNRLRALRNYAATLDPSCHLALQAEAERAANELVRCGELPAAMEALTLARALGGDPPTTKHPLLRACKRLFGPLRTLRLQQYVRAAKSRAR
jgi:glycosyltransferase involved in cell wall biosynthesis